MGGIAIKIQSICTITQCLNRFISKHVDIKKIVAITVAVWILHGIPIHIHADWDKFWEDVNAEWELLNPNENKDFTYSFNYLVMDFGGLWRVMHLAYLGKPNDEHLFIGARAFIMMNGEIVIDKAVNSLVGRDGVIKNKIVGITERKHIHHPDKPFYDLTVLAIKDVDMDDYEPIATVLIQMWIQAWKCIPLSLTMRTYLIFKTIRLENACVNRGTLMLSGGWVSILA